MEYVFIHKSYNYNLILRPMFCFKYGILEFWKFDVWKIFKKKIGFWKFENLDFWKIWKLYFWKNEKYIFEKYGFYMFEKNENLDFIMRWLFVMVKCDPTFWEYIFLSVKLFTEIPVLYNNGLGWVCKFYKSKNTTKRNWRTILWLPMHKVSFMEKIKWFWN